jgi:hypothetical protein
MRDLTQFYSISNDLNLNNNLKHSTFDNESRILYSCDDLLLIGIDTDTGTVFFSHLSFSTLNDSYFNFLKVKSEFDLFELKCSDREENKIVSIQYLTEMNSIFLANVKGDLMILNLIDGSVECVGCVVDGIQSIDWSPDQELLVIISGLLFNLVFFFQSNLEYFQQRII